MTRTTKRLEKKSAGKNNAAKATRAGFSDPAVDAVFNAYPRPIKARLLALRRLIFDTAKTTKGVGALQETLKWGQPSYLTAETKSGSTIRIDQVKSAANQYAVRSEEHTSELQSPCNLVCRLLLEKKKKIKQPYQQLSEDKKQM